MNLKKKIFTGLALSLAVAPAFAQTPAPADSAQDADTLAVPVPQSQVMYVAPLFEYIMAPDNLPDIVSRSNYIMENFWKPFDFTQNAVSQVALDHAFKVFITPLRWADPEVAEKSIKTLLRNIESNPAMLVQFMKAAEQNLYGDNAEMWVDGAYLKFLNAFLNSKKVPQSRKPRYEVQRTTIMNSLQGQKMPLFQYTDPEGKVQKLSFNTPLTLLEFGDPMCSDCLMMKVKLQSPEIKKLITDGVLRVLFIIPDADVVDNWQRSLYTLPLEWKAGVGSELDMVYDIRVTPSVYLLDDRGVIIEKFLNPDNVEAVIMQYASPER